MKSSTKEQDIVESSEDSSDSDDKFNAPLGSLNPQRSPQMIREKSPPPPTLDIGDYRKHPQISRTFFPKIVAQNRGCGLSAGTFQKGAVPFSELTLL